VGRALLAIEEEERRGCVPEHAAHLESAWHDAFLLFLPSGFGILCYSSWAVRLLRRDAVPI
jgi:hypothetical protein